MWFYFRAKERVLDLVQYPFFGTTIKLLQNYIPTYIRNACRMSEVKDKINQSGHLRDRSKTSQLLFSATCLHFTTSMEKMSVIFLLKIVSTIRRSFCREQRPFFSIGIAGFRYLHYTCTQNTMWFTFDQDWQLELFGSARKSSEYRKNPKSSASLK